MNIHPIVVHFPIALLTIYALLEIFTTKKLKDNETWFFIKSTFLFLGTLGAFAGLLTGNIAANGIESELIETHERWAQISTIIFVFLSLIYASLIKERYFGERVRQILGESFLFTLYKKGIVVAHSLNKRVILILLALLGLIALTVTGALGGTIVRGPDADFITKFIYSILF